MLYSNSITSVREVEDFLSLFIQLEEKGETKFPSLPKMELARQQLPDKALIHDQRKHNLYELKEEEEEEKGPI